MRFTEGRITNPWFTGAGKLRYAKQVLGRTERSRKFGRCHIQRKGQQRIVRHATTFDSAWPRPIARPIGRSVGTGNSSFRNPRTVRCLSRRRTEVNRSDVNQVCLSGSGRRIRPKQPQNGMFSGGTAPCTIRGRCCSCPVAADQLQPIFCESRAMSSTKTSKFCVDTWNARQPNATDLNSGGKVNCGIPARGPL